MAILTKLVNNDKLEDDVLFLSYNSTGFNLQRADFITELISILGENKLGLSCAKLRQVQLSCVKLDWINA